MQVDKINPYENFIKINDSVDIGLLDQKEFFYSDNFNNILTSGTHSGTVNYNNSWIKADTNKDSDSSNITSSITFNPTLSTLSITSSASVGYHITGWSNRNLYGKNKLLNFSAIPTQGINPNAQLKFIDTNNIGLVPYIEASGLSTGFVKMLTRVSGVDTQVYNADNASPATGDANLRIPNFSGNTRYKVCLKTFNHLCAYLIIEPSLKKVVNHGYFFSPTFNSFSSTVNALGVNGETQTVVYKDFNTKNIKNFTNFICIGDSNTEGNAGAINLRDIGQNYVQELNNTFKDQNLYFLNKVYSGYTSYEFASGGLQDISVWLPNVFLPGAKNIVNIFLGTNDASEQQSHAYNLSTTIDNLKYIIKKAKDTGAIVWICTYPPRNDSVIFNKRVIEINSEIRKLETDPIYKPDRIIDLWKLFVKNEYYDSVNSNEQGNYLQTDDLHFSGSGNTVISNEISKNIFRDLNLNPSLENIFVKSKIHLTGADGGYIHSSPNGIAVPNFVGNTSVGTKWIIYKDTTSDYAIGLESNKIWFTCGTGATNGYSFYNETITPTLKINSNSQNLSTTSNTITNSIGALNLNGHFVFSGSGNTVIHNTTGLGAPSFTTRTAGIRNISFPSISGSSVDFARGMETGAMYDSVATLTDEYRVYNGIQKSFSISGTTTSLFTNFSVPRVSATVTTGTPSATINGMSGVVTFTTPNINAGANSPTVTITNSSVTTNSIILLTARHTGAGQLHPKLVGISSGSFQYLIQNTTSTSTGDVLVYFLIIN